MCRIVDDELFDNIIVGEYWSEAGQLIKGAYSTANDGAIVVNVNFSKAVCVESIDVGKIAVSTPILEIIGNATVSEHFPKHDMSCIDTILFISFPPFSIYIIFLGYLQ